MNLENAQMKKGEGEGVRILITNMQMSITTSSFYKKNFKCCNFDIVEF